MGPSRPTREAAFTSTFSLFNDFRIYTQFDYRGGHWVENSTDSFRCNGGIIYCRGLVDPDAPLYNVRTVGDLRARSLGGDVVAIEQPRIVGANVEAHADPVRGGEVERAADGVRSGDDSRFLAGGADVKADPPLAL